MELVMMCTDENNIEEFMEICYPLCCQVYDKDPGGIKKMMWYEIVKHPPLDPCTEERESAFTHRHLNPGKEEETSQLD